MRIINDHDVPDKHNRRSALSIDTLQSRRCVQSVNKIEIKLQEKVSDQLTRMHLYRFAPANWCWRNPTTTFYII